MTEKPLILICNDDGVYADGIRQLWESVQSLGEIVVVAPSGQQSAVSLSITTRTPLKVSKVKWNYADANVWSVNGTPVDCVKLALHAVLPRTPDLILSGINRGSNAGQNVLYSGTVAAVIEGAIRQIPGIAFSAADYINPSYEGLQEMIPTIVNYVLNKSLPSGTFLNVNFPDTKQEKIHGIRLTKQGKEYLIENPEQRHHPFEQEPYYWLGAKTAHFEEEEDCDISWLKKGFATAVPICVSNLTHEEHLEQERSAFESFTKLKSVNLCSKK